MANRLITYLTVLGVVLIGFHIAGLIQDTPSQVILNFIKNPDTFQNSSIYLQIVSILTALGVAGVAVGLAFGDRVQWALTTGLAAILLTVGWDIIAIFNLIADFNPTLALMLISPFVFIYMMVVMEWWRSRD